jgi:hypothetical protein
MIQEIIMPHNKRCQSHLKPMLHGSLAALMGMLSISAAQADDEIRAGAVVQIPFSLQSLVDFSTIRVGLSCQYADVEEDEITTTHHLTRRSIEGIFLDITETSLSTSVDEGKQVLGVEGNFMIEPFNSWNPSLELLGFYGNTDIQGALGAGYDWSGDYFFDAKVMFPYAEIGIRFPEQLEIYGGLKTLGSFNPAKEYHHREIVTDINIPTSSE